MTARAAALCLLTGALGCGSNSGKPGELRLESLSVDGVQLTPTFNPSVSEYQAQVNVLIHTVRLHARASRGTSLRVRADSGDVLASELQLKLGENLLELELQNPDGATRVVRLSLTRTHAPWEQIQVLTARTPVEDGFFGDYLRASASDLYVNGSRRGLLYRLQGETWAFERPAASLFSSEPAWMFEAAIGRDALALIAEPEGGVETLYFFSRDERGEWVQDGEHPTGTQGTLRLAGDDLVFVSERELSFFRRETQGFRLSQTLAAPAQGIGFAERSTYFDARGVSLAGDVLVVGAPRDSSSSIGVDGPLESDCEGAAESCVRHSGAVFVYERDSAGNWQLGAYLKPPALAPGLGFGATTGVHGAWLAVGARNDGSDSRGHSEPGLASACDNAQAAGCLPESGAVYLFQRTEQGWQPRGSLKPSLTRAYDYFGDTLLLSGDTLLVGAPGQDSAPGANLQDTSAPESGGVFVFVRQAGVFQELGLHKLPVELAAPFPFPAELELAGDRLVVAANQATVPGANGEVLTNAGLVYYLY